MMSWRNTLLVSIGFILQSGLLLFSSASFAQVFEVTQLTHNSIDERSPDMNDAGQIVWYQWDESDYEIFLHDGTSVTQITDDSFDNRNPLINNRGDVAWRGHDGSDWEIFLCDGVSVAQITDNSYDDQLRGINDLGDLVWIGDDGSDDEIFLYQGTTTTQLTDNTYDDRFPRLNNAGQVVWVGSVSADFVFFYDGNEIVELPESENGSSPQINDQGKVVFAERNDGGPIIDTFRYFLYDGTTSSLISPTYYWGEGEPHINENGLVAWAGSLTPYEDPDYDHDIFLYDGVETRQLVRFEKDYNLHVNNVGEVVWAGFDLLGLDNEVFYYNGSGVSQLTFNSYDDSAPQINNIGEILWTATMGGGGTTEIFLAKPMGSACSDTATASTVSVDQVHGPSDLGKHLVYLLFPMGAIIGLSIWRRKR